MSSDFVNRKDESIFIKDWVYSNADENKGIFIYAKSGIGKSQFITELFENELPDYIKIKVDMIGSDVSVVESYWLIKRLYRKMIQNTEKNSTLPLTERLSLDSNLSVSFYLGVNISLSDKNGYAEEIAHIMTYLKRKLSDGNKYIIDIENFQLVDQESMDCLKQLFCIGSGHRYILEFTMDPACISSQFYHLFSQISSAIDCQIYELKKLKLQEVNVLCERKHLPLNTAQELYNKNDGNLFPLIMLPFSPISNSLQPLFDIIDALTIDQRMILFLIELSHGELTISNIKEIFALGVHLLTGSDKYTESYLELLYTELNDKELVKINGQDIIIRQDQIMESIRTYRKHPEYYLAWNLFENFHQESLHGKTIEERKPHILALLHAYSIFPDIKLSSILPDLSIIILQQPPQKMIEEIQAIRTQMELTDENHNFVYFLSRYLTDICIAVGQWQIALDQVDGKYSEDIPWQACYLAAVLAANPQIPDAESRIIRMRKKHQANIIPYMSITVSLLSYYLRTMPELKVKVIGKNFLDEFTDQSNLNYAFLLKLYSNVLDDENAINTLKQCNHIFRKYKRDDLIAMNMITIGSRNVYMGHPEIGLKILKCVEKKIAEHNIIIRRHYLLNNKSAISLLTGDFNEQTLDDLIVAFYSTDSQFEKAIILCNQMIYYILIGDLIEAKQTFQTIKTLELSQYNNIDLRFILLKNTMFYYESIQDWEKAQIAQSQLIAFASSDDCPDDVRIHILSLFPEDYPQYAGCAKSFLAQFRFQAEFIGYWQCEVSYDNDGKNHIKAISAPWETTHFES